MWWKALVARRSAFMGHIWKMFLCAEHKKWTCVIDRECLLITIVKSSFAILSITAKRGSRGGGGLYYNIYSFLGHRSQRPQWPIVITRCPASVRRPSVVRRPLDYLHFRLLLQNRLMDFDESWYGWSTQGPLQVLLFFGQIRPGADPGRGKNRSRGVPFFRKLLLQTGRLQQQTECIAVI